MQGNVCQKRSGRVASDIMEFNRVLSILENVIN